MTNDKDFKRIVRERAKRTGESYAEALRQLRAKDATRPRRKEPPMTIVRAIPDVRSNDLDSSREFYRTILGFDLCMDERNMLMFCSPTNPKVQVTVNGDGIPLPPGFAVDVGTPDRVDAIHAEVLARGLTVVEPLDSKPWGIHRFSVLDPNGTRVTVLAHLRQEDQ